MRALIFESPHRELLLPDFLSMMESVRFVVILDTYKRLIDSQTTRVVFISTLSFFRHVDDECRRHS